jgi:tripartite-type tricarboxylate transporter receptor subunit TctC
VEQTVVVDNLGGAGGALGAQKVLAEPADGRFLLQASPNEVILAPALNPAVKLRVDDFTLVQPIVRGVLVLLVSKDLPVRNADELVALAPQPTDRPLSYGSVGVGSLNHLIMEQVQHETGTRFLHVPYKGSAPLLQDLGGGQIDVAVVVYSGSPAGLVEKGVMKIIGQFGAQRSALLPQVPAVNEGAALHRLSFTTWSGVMVRKETPRATISRLNHSLAKVMQSPQLSDSLTAQFLEPMPPMSLEDAAKFFRSEVESYRRMLATVDVKMQ